jgi:hypothetical protein
MDIARHSSLPRHKRRSSDSGRTETRASSATTCPCSGVDQGTVFIGGVLAAVSAVGQLRAAYVMLGC